MDKICWTLQPGTISCDVIQGWILRNGWPIKPGSMVWNEMKACQLIETNVDNTKILLNSSSLLQLVKINWIGPWKQNFTFIGWRPVANEPLPPSRGRRRRERRKFGQFRSGFVASRQTRSSRARKDCRRRRRSGRGQQRERKHWTVCYTSLNVFYLLHLASFISSFSNVLTSFDNILFLDGIWSHNQLVVSLFDSNLK